MTVSNYSTTSANNTTINNISIAEGMPPSNVNNAIRNELKDVREVWNDKEWFILGDGDGATVFTRTGNTTVTVPTDITSTHHVGRRVKIIGTQTGTVYSHISASAYSAPNTTLTFASGTINASDSTVDVYVGSTYVNPSIPVIDNNSLGSSTVLPASQNSVKTYVESGTHTITNKTINLANNTLTGTTAQFNTALSNNDFTTLAGAETLTNKTLTSPVLNTGLSGTAFLDEDNMASNSATKAASQQSIKAYVDSTITNQDLDFAGASGSGAVDLDSQTFTIAAGEGIDTVASGQTLTVSGEDATTSNKGVASFSSDNFAVNSGVVTIKDNGVANAELVNDSVNFGGITVALGGSDTTPALNLTDAANYPTSSLTGTIANSQLATGIDATKIADGSVTSSEFQYINTLSSNAQDQLTAKLVKASNLSDVSSASTSRTNLGLGTIATQASNSISISGGSITGMGTPSNNTDVANKSYVDQAIAGLRNRTVAECASTANVNLSNGLEAGDTIDGVTLVAGDRVLIKNNSTATENGLYLAVASGAGAASRDPEHDTIAELSGGMITVSSGSQNDNKIFLCTTDSDGSIGSTNIVYTQVTPSNTGTVESVGITQSGSEFTIGNTPITSTGNITLNVNRISATKIGSGTSVSDTNYGYLSNVSSDIQTQLNAKASAGFALAMAVAL
tara:strand:- start:415 stop:2454 length:2040 start_codon:yes stop_codon:yes gene_type:complete